MKGQSLIFYHQQWLVGDAPSVWNLCSKYINSTSGREYLAENVFSDIDFL